MMAALACVFMLISYFPYLTYAIPAISGLFIMIVLIEIDFKWALVAYFSSVVIVFLTAEPESKLLYVFLFGYYPILKGLIEKIKKPFTEWVLKIAVFNTSVLIVYFVFAGMFGISLDGFDDFGKYSAAVTLAVGNAAFVLYDIAISKMAVVYISLVQPKLRKIFKNKY